MSTTAKASDPDWLATPIDDVLSTLRSERFGTGPLAELRRLDPRKPPSFPPTFYRLLATHVPPELTRRAGAVQDWALIFHCIALAGTDLPLKSPGIGAALAADTHSEARLTALLKARRDQLSIVAPRVVRYLRAQGQGFDVHDLARLILWPTEEIRIRIARDFYERQSKPSDEKKKEQ